MFQPFGSSSLAQEIINSKLSNVSASTPMTAQDVNEFGVFRNPYSPKDFYANESDVNPKPPFTPPVDDAEGNPVCDNENGYFFDPISQSCKLINSDVTSNDSDNNQMTQPVYQGVGSVFSPTQNAFTNLGLGAEGLTADTAKSYYGSGEIDPYGSGFSGMFRRFTPMGQLSTYLDTNRLINSGVLNKASDGTLTFAKGGNLNLVKANQAFEQDLARKQGLNLDAKSENSYTDQLGNEQFMVQSRGDKADDVGTIDLKGRSSRPFQSNYGASNIVSYNNNAGDSSKGRSMQNFNRRQQQKKYSNTAQTGAKSGFRYGL